MMATPGMNPPGGRDTAAAFGRDTLEAMIEGRLEVVPGGTERGPWRGRRGSASDEVIYGGSFAQPLCSLKIHRLGTSV
jgi:hypothetical protein